MEITLLDAEVDKKYRIVRFDGKDAASSRLIDIGFIPSVSIEIKEKTNHSLVVQVLNSRFAISNDLAKKVYIRELKPKNELENNFLL